VAPIFAFFDLPKHILRHICYITKYVAIQRSKIKKQRLTATNIFGVKNTNAEKKIG